MTSRHDARAPWALSALLAVLAFGIIAMHGLTSHGSGEDHHAAASTAHEAMAGDMSMEAVSSPEPPQDAHIAIAMCVAMLVGLGALAAAVLLRRNARRPLVLPLLSVPQVAAVPALRAPPSLHRFSILRC